MGVEITDYRRWWSGKEDPWEKRDRLEVFQIAFAQNPAKKEFT